MQSNNDRSSLGPLWLEEGKFFCVLFVFREKHEVSQSNDLRIDIKAENIVPG